MNNGTFIKTKNTVNKMNQNFLIAVLFVLIFGLCKHYIIFNIYEMNIQNLAKPFILILFGIFISTIIGDGYARYILKLKDEQRKKYLKQNRFWIYNLLLILCMPISIPLWIYIVSFIVVTLYKIIESKFNKVKLNPVAIGILLIMLLSQLFEININYEYSYAFNRIIFGNEQILASSPLILLIAFLYLSFTKTIKNKISVITILYSIILYWFIACLCHIDNYVLAHTIIGSILFFSIFVATDSFTSPVTPVGQTLYSLQISILALIFSYILSLSSIRQVSMAMAIIFSNLLTPKLDVWGDFVRGNMKRYSAISLIIIIFGFVVAFQISRYI